MFSPVRSLRLSPAATLQSPQHCIFQVFKDPMDDFQAPPVPDSEFPEDDPPVITHGWTIRGFSSKPRLISGGYPLVN